MQRPLQQILRAGADELSDLAKVADQLGSLGMADIERWQSLDRMSQHLSGMAGVLLALSAALPEHPIDLSQALARLTTAALADRLAGQVSETAVDAGEMELFGG